MAKLAFEFRTVILSETEASEQVSFLQVRKHIAEHLNKGRYPIRVDISWEYAPTRTGMPPAAIEADWETFEESLIPNLERNNLALLTYYITGQNRRLWSFYTRNLKAFERTLNNATENLPLYPLNIYAEEDLDRLALQEVLTTIPQTEE